ncbi:Epoxide hydrolase-like [Trema orientale]|uniref:Epoxide hydrolase-like n=1 Tax=Trema orientale TaxID=63057 RepID=A0A2P5ETF4_TREOI|nr:Epoxide hydrolase-like [Trema orientale]
MAWYFCLFRPERVKALVNLSVPFIRRNPDVKTFNKGLRAFVGDDFYVFRFQEPGEIEKELASIDTTTVLKIFHTSFDTTPLCIPKEGLRGFKVVDPLPSWLSEDYINYCASKSSQKGFTGRVNYYRAVNLTWELLAPWTGAQIKVPTKFITGDQDSTYCFLGFKDYIESGEFKKDVPSLQEVVITKGVGHFINQAKPEEISAHIYEFIKKF